MISISNNPTEILSKIAEIKWDIRKPEGIELEEVIPFLGEHYTRDANPESVYKELMEFYSISDLEAGKPAIGRYDNDEIYQSLKAFIQSVFSEKTSITGFKFEFYDVEGNTPAYYECTIGYRSVNGYFTSILSSDLWPINFNKEIV